MELFIPGPTGRLEALLDDPEEGSEPIGAAVVCHPHPLFGGTMHNTVVFRTAKGLRRAGLVTLRFNFRGVEKSEGSHHGEGGEVLDAAAGLDWLAERYPGLPLWAAGFSFGSRTVLQLAHQDERVKRAVCVALPVLRFDCEGAGRLRQPAFFVFAGNDEYGTLAAMRERVPEPPAHYEMHEIDDTDHFFKRKTPLLEEAVYQYASRGIAEDS